MIKILSFDCSSTTIGYAVLEVDNNINFIDVNYIKPEKDGSLITKIANTRDKINTIINQVKPDHIAIEDIIAFMKGKSTAQTIIMLTTFNRMICLAAYDYLNKEPSLHNVMSIRHGLKNSKVLPKKEEMPELVAKHLNIKFPYQYSKKGRVKGKAIIENQDMADAIAVGLYYSFLLTGKIKKKVKK
jgi:Holliday junction resolvasome RuvABC endonuclease subunit